MGQGSVAGQCESAVLIARSIYRSVCERALDGVCERRCWGTVIWASFCVSNLLTQFLGSGVRCGVSTFFYFYPPHLSSRCAFESLCDLLAAACLPGLLWTNNTLFSLLLASYSSSLAHSSGFHTVTCLCLFIISPGPFPLICSPSDVLKKKILLCWCCLWGIVFQG